MFGLFRKSPQPQPQPQPQPADDLAAAITRLVNVRVEQHMAAMVAEWEAQDAIDDAAEDAERERRRAEGGAA